MTSDLAVITAFTVATALAATAVMLVPGIGLAWLLARRVFPGKALVEAVAALPLVMPPVATGFALLWLFGTGSPLGRWLGAVGIDVVFTPMAVVLAMAVMGFPLLVRTARAGFEQSTVRYEQIAETLGASPWRIFTTVTLPLASRPILAGALLGFSRALGEFGATIVVAGSIPGRTQTLAVWMYSLLEQGHDGAALRVAGVSAAIALTGVWLSNRLVREV